MYTSTALWDVSRWKITKAGNGKAGLSYDLFATLNSRACRTIASALASPELLKVCIEFKISKIQNSRFHNGRSKRIQPVTCPDNLSSYHSPSAVSLRESQRRSLSLHSTAERGAITRVAHLTCALAGGHLARLRFRVAVAWLLGAASPSVYADCRSARLVVYSRYLEVGTHRRGRNAPRSVHVSPTTRERTMDSTIDHDPSTLTMLVVRSWNFWTSPHGKNRARLFTPVCDSDGRRFASRCVRSKSHYENRITLVNHGVARVRDLQIDTPAFAVSIAVKDKPCIGLLTERYRDCGPASLSTAHETSVCQSTQSHQRWSLMRRGLRDSIGFLEFGRKTSERAVKVSVSRSCFS